MSKNSAEWRPLSHYERVANPECSVRPSLARFNKPYVQRCRVEQVVEGRVMSTLGWKTVLPSDNFEGVSARDFALENVIAAGALDTFRERQVSLNTRGEMSDAVEFGMDVLSNAIDNNAQDTNG